MRKAITEKEWGELVTLEYVLTHGYSEHPQSDEKRYRLLSDRKWNHGYAFDIDNYYKRMVASWNSNKSV
jgi:hypothetical protein